MPVKFFSEVVNHKKVLHLEGRLDARAIAVLQKEIEILLEQGERFFVMDFSQITYLSSAGIRFLLLLTHRLYDLKGKIVFCHISQTVLNVIQRAGFERQLAIYLNLETAINSFS